MPDVNLTIENNNVTVEVQPVVEEVVVEINQFGVVNTVTTDPSLAIVFALALG